VVKQIESESRGGKLKTTQIDPRNKAVAHPAAYGRPSLCTKKGKKGITKEEGLGCESPGFQPTFGEKKGRKTGLTKWKKKDGGKKIKTKVLSTRQKSLTPCQGGKFL